jgi:Sec-independent protein secretion pathway component TatC
MLLQIILSIVIFIASVPLSYLFSRILKDEKDLYLPYLPFASIVFLILSAVSFFYDLAVALTVANLFFISLFLKWFTKKQKN